MMMSPGILALMTVSVLVAAYALYAAGAGLHILAGWDAGSSAEAQLARERKTILLSSLVSLLMLLDLLCLGFFVALADQLHGLFPGAMCAAGTLHAHAYGMPALLVMLTGFVLCVLWLVVNHVDTLAPHFSLIRLKYVCLGPVALVLGAQAFLVVNFFRALNPTLITSCCATLFSEAGQGMGSEVAHLSPGVMQPLFWGMLLTSLGVGALSLRVGALDRLYAGVSVLMLPVGLAAIISFISVRIYELPTHHCPFCLLQPEYGYAGYPLYTGLLLGAALGMGVGIVRWLGDRATLRTCASDFARRLKWWSLAGYAWLAVMAGRPFLHSDLHL